MRKTSNAEAELRSSVLKSAMLPFLFLLVCWMVFGFESYFHENLANYGVQPRSIKGLRGVVFMPFLHGDLSHLLNNSFAFGVLATMLFFFYKEIAFTVFAWVFFMSGVWTWSLANTGTHIGASAVIYGLFSFLALSGVLRGNKNLLALTFLVIVSHQGMVWGVLPSKPGISWQGHFSGLLAGIVLAIYFRKQGPQREVIMINDDDSPNEYRFGKYYWDPVKREEELARKAAEEQQIVCHFREDEK